MTDLTVEAKYNPMNETKQHSLTDNRPTAASITMADVMLNPPRTGQNVLAVSKGGRLCDVVWQADSYKNYVCWAPYPKIPQSSKERMLELYLNG